MAAALLRQHLAATGTKARVASAGFLDEGRPAAPRAVAVLASRGLDIAGHRSRRVTAEDVRRADLVIGMTSTHVRDAVLEFKSTLDHTFRFRELLRRATATGGRAGTETVATWLARVGEHRRARELVGTTDDDIPDPIGAPMKEYERTASELDDLARRLAAFLR
jgi:protein-tyrosine-phosphatase